MARRTRPPGTTRAVVTFALTGLVPVILLGVVSVELLRRQATEEAVRDAERLTSVSSRFVEPFVTDAVIAGDLRARARLDRVVRRRLLRDPVVRVKIWTRDGRIVYSDEPRLVGSRYDLGEEDRQVLDAGGSEAEAEVSDLDPPENRFERRYGKLLEVYLPVATPSGQRVLFESYQRFSSVAETSRRLWVRFIPALVATLLVLWLLQLPLSLRLARRLRRGEAERAALLQRTLDASDRERRRIAQHLHDGAVQHFTGVGYQLAAAAEELPEPEAVPLREAAAETRLGVRELRSLLVDIYPAEVQRVGLAAAIDDLARPLREDGIEVDADIPDDLTLRPEVEALFFRVTQEALRNVATHADATHVDVCVRDNGAVELVVTDDGQGFDVAERRAEGHFGLRLIEDAAADVGGTAVVSSGPGNGTRVRVEVPHLEEP